MESSELSPLFYNWQCVNLSLSKFIENNTMDISEDITYTSPVEFQKYMSTNKLQHENLPPVYIYTNKHSLCYSFEKNKRKLLMKMWCGKNSDTTNITIYVSYIFSLYVDTRRDQQLGNIISHLINQRAGSINILKNIMMGSNIRDLIDSTEKSSFQRKLFHHLFCSVEMPAKITIQVKCGMQYVLTPWCIKYIVNRMILKDVFSMYPLRPINIPIHAEIDFFYKLLFRCSDFQRRCKYNQSKIPIVNTGSNIYYYAYQSNFYDVTKMCMLEWDNLISDVNYMHNRGEIISHFAELCLGARGAGLVTDVVTIILKYYLLNLSWRTSMTHINLEHNYEHRITTKNRYPFYDSITELDGGHLF